MEVYLCFLFFVNAFDAFFQLPLAYPFKALEKNCLYPDSRELIGE